MTAPVRHLTHIPALDSLRALAVIGVLAYHHDPSRVAGGWLGVSMFFTLSGFLIAGLLIAEHEQTARIDLGGFWNRRIRRLLPASLAAIGLTAVVVAVDSAQQATDVAADVRAAVLNFANWHFVSEDAPYAGTQGVASPVQHYWSLAIEEQFYVAFPLVAAFALRRRLLPAVVLVTIAISLALQVALASDVDRAYFGTDTRAGELAAGVGLALALPAIRRRLGRRTAVPDLLGAVGLAAMVFMFSEAHLSSDLLGSGGLTAVTVVWVSLLVAAVCGRHVPDLLGRGALPAVGRLSYGIYLYHWPVYLLATTPRTGLDGPALLSVRVLVTVALAVLSSQLLELPIRRRASRPRLVLATGAAAVALVVLATTLVPELDRPSDHLDLAATYEPPPGIGTGEASRPTTGEGAAERLGKGVDTDGGEAAQADRARRPPRLLVVGDSTAAVTGGALQEVGAADGTAEVHLLHQPGCATYRYEAALVRDGYVYRSPCGDILGEATTAAHEVDPDAIVVFIGSAQLFDSRYEGDSEYRSFLDPSVSARYQEVLRGSLDELGRLGIPVLWADVPTPAWDLDVFGEMLGGPMPGSGPVTSNDPARAALLNDLDQVEIAGRPGTLRWGYTQAIAGEDGEIDPEHRPDGLHLDPAHADRMARESIFPALQAAYRAAEQGAAGRDGDAATNSWSP